jgi:uncharacterized membrane protein YwaF
MFFGSWPWYLLSVEMIAVVTFLLLGLPWRISGWMRNRKRRRRWIIPEDAERTYEEQQ